MTTTKTIFAARADPIKKSSKGKGSNSNAAIKGPKNRIKARLLTRFERQVIAQRLLLKASVENSMKSLNQSVQQNETLSHQRLDQQLKKSYSEPLRFFETEYMRSTRNSRVKFRETVSITEIPSFHSYSKDVRKKLWSGQKEIQINAMRNRREFASDGCDITRVREEEDFLVLRGELVHPDTCLRDQRHQQKMLIRRLRAARKMNQMMPEVDRVLYSA